MDLKRIKPVFIYELGKAIGSLNVMTIHVSTLSRFGDKISKIVFQREIDKWNIITFVK